MTTQSYSVQTLRDYLLGLLPDEEAQRLDELSIVDDECAGRIRAVEHDLVDAFARDELDGVQLQRFRSRYLASPHGRESIRFARALQSLKGHPGQETSQAVPLAPATFWQRSRWRERLTLAAALILLASASVWLALDNRALRARVTIVESSRDELGAGQARAAEAPPPPANTAPRVGDRDLSPPIAATLVLAPQLRSAGQLPTVALPDGTTDLPVRLDLEPVDYPSYEASLMVTSSNRQLWRADRLSARTAGGRQTLDLRLPTTVLNPQEYLIRVSGVPARGAPDIVGEYRFVVVR
jgi:hypothetical protein